MSQLDIPTVQHCGSLRYPHEKHGDCPGNPARTLPLSERCPKLDHELRRCLRPPHPADERCHYPDGLRAPEALRVARIDRLRRTPVSSW